MNIIFKENLTNIEEKYVILDLDTFSFPNGKIHTACCLVENIPITELSETDRLKELHTNLISNFGKKDWNYCEQAIDHLVGKWGGELDSFYTELKSRIDLLKTMDLDDSWSPIIARV